MVKKHDHHLDILHSMESFGIVDDNINKIRCTELQNRLNPKVPFPHKHNFFFVMFVTEGSGWHEIDFIRYKVKPGSAFFMNPAQVHSWSLSPDTKGVVIEFESTTIFSKDGDYKVFENLISIIDSVTYLKKDELAQITSLFEFILKDYINKNKNFEIGIRAYLINILLMLAQNSKPKEIAKTKQSELIEHFYEILELNFHHEHEIDFYATALKINAKSLSEKLKRLLGKSLRNIIQDRCLLESKRLLAYSELSINEIALKIGYEDANYFARLFKLKTKLSPGEFRKRTKECC